MNAEEPAAADPPPQSGRRRLATPQRLSLGLLLLATAVLYTWNLGASGYGNDFYAAAVQAGTKSWKAFFFGSFDSSNFITVDKPPAALWPMEISGRIFGFNSWSMLVPQAIEGVLTVWLLYATVRRWFGHGAGLLAGALLAVTPVAVLMFRFNNPDALMVLIIMIAAYCTTRALEKGSTTWLLLAGGAMGFSFLAKGLQPFTVLPALALAYLICAPTSLKRRVLQLLGAGVAIIVGAGWWVLAVDLTPAADRPYIGGSGNNTALGLAFGYNGLDRLSSTGGGPGGGAGGGFSGTAGASRLFNSLNGAQISWLLPTALVAVLGLIYITGRRPRTDRTYAALIVFGGWVLVTGAVLSYATGVIHTYYTVELAPAIAALVAIGTVGLWRARATLAARIALAASLLASGIWGFVLIGRASSWEYAWVRYVLLVIAVAVAVAVLVPTLLSQRTAVVTALTAGVVALGGGSTAYALDTAALPHTGSIPSAGPASASGGFGGAGFGRRTGAAPAGGFGGAAGAGGPGGEFPGGGPGGFPGSGTGATPGTGPAPAGTAAGSGTAPTGTADGSTRAAGRGGFGGTASANSALTALLKKTDTTWAAAAIGSQSAGPLELASGKAVMAIGGFSGSDAAPTLAQFKAYVAAGKIRYFISGGGTGGGMGGRGGTSSEITTWVQAHYTATTVGGSTVYDLTKATS